MNQRRVVITGVGIISALGNNVEDFRENLFAGKPGFREIKSVDMSTIRFKKGAEVVGFKPEDHFDESKLINIKRFTQFAVVNARQAVDAAGVEWNDELRERTAIITGTGSGGLADLDFEYEELYRHDKTRPRPLTIAKAMCNAGASLISMEYGVSGPTYTVTTACSSANHAIGQAFWYVRQGLVDMALSGGSETPFALGNLKAWEGMRVVSPDTCRPFSKDRSGMVLGEGGAMFVLETLESAAARGAEICAEIVGFGMSADAHHLTQPLTKGASKAMRDALRDGGVAPEQIGYINAHGTATQANDLMETEAIREVFGEHADNLAVSSTKSMHGHTLGAAGAIEATATVLALKHGILPPTANFTEPGDGCDLDYVPNEAREKATDFALCNSFAFGGLNATLVFKRWDG